MSERRWKSNTNSVNVYEFCNSYAKQTVCPLHHTSHDGCPLIRCQYYKMFVRLDTTYGIYENKRQTNGSIVMFIIEVLSQTTGEDFRIPERSQGLLGYSRVLAITWDQEWKNFQQIFKTRLLFIVFKEKIFQLNWKLVLSFLGYFKNNFYFLFYFKTILIQFSCYITKKQF